MKECPLTDDEKKTWKVEKTLSISYKAKIKEMGYHQIYLNASPMGFEGLNITDLVWFYKGFGFKEILNQGHNVQMLLNI